MQNLLIATTNSGKVQELKQFLSDTNIRLKSLDEFASVQEPKEDGNSFLENAILKAKYYAKRTDCPAFADDSGLEVDSLANDPGIFSARYAGEDATDEQNVVKLLSELENSNRTDRKARFVCEIAVADIDGSIIQTARGICEGEIALKPQGNKGFGYDPVFIPTGYSETFGELSSDIKKRISHRSKAVRQIIKFLREYRSP